MQNDQPRGPQLPVSSSAGRIVLATTVLGSSVAMLTSTVVNVALPRMAADLGADTAEQQWIINAYLLTLAALILIGGGIGDRYGRRRVYLWGLGLFTLSSVACAAAPNVEVLIGCRLVQGIGAALLTPGSLAILESVIQPSDRGRAIGLWSGLGGLAAAIGPLVGGLLVEISWRWVFLVNVPLAAVVAWLARSVPETRDPSAEAAPLDVLGAVLTAVALGGLSYALIQGPDTGFGVPEVVALGLAAAAFGGLLWWEPGRDHAVVPLDLFASRVFAAANLLTLFVYAGLGIVFLLLSIQLQVTAGWSPLAAGASLMPVTVLMMLLSSYAGDLASRIGPKWPLTLGPWGMAAGMALFVFVDDDTSFLTDVLPATIVFGTGLAVSVAPVTSTALGAVPEERAGAASGANTAIARTGQLLAVAAIPPLVGLSGDALSDPAQLAVGFPQAILLAAGLVATGGLVAWLFLPSKTPGDPDYGKPGPLLDEPHR